MALAGFTILALAPHAAQAQVRAGVHGLYTSRAFDGTFGAGARAEIDLDFLRDGLVLAGVWDRRFTECDGCTLSEVGGQLLMAPLGSLYLGFGAGRKLEADSEAPEGLQPDFWNLYLVAGLRLQGIPILQPYLEYRQELASGGLNEQTFVAGILLGPVRRRTAPQRLRP